MENVKSKVEVFTFDSLEEIVEGYFDETEERENAAITFDNGTITLTTVKFKDVEVAVYQVKESQEIYDKMDELYMQILENQSTGSDFWDMWSAIIQTLEPYKIVDEVMLP